jgi:hypothetical protein
MNDSGPGLIDAVIQSWRLVLGNARDLVRIGLVPFVIFMGLERLEKAVMPDEGYAVLGWTLLFTILPAVPAAMLLMPWLRSLLAARDPALAARPVGWWSVVLTLRWAGLDVMFFAAMMPVTVMSIQVGMEGGGQPGEAAAIFIMFWAIFILGSYLIYGRLGLSLPAAAAESDHSYRKAWSVTGSYGWRIGFAVILCWLSIQIPVDLLREPLKSDDPTAVALFLDAALTALSRTINELLSAAVFAQFYIARAARTMQGEW